MLPFIFLGVYDKKQVVFQVAERRVGSFEKHLTILHKFGERQNSLEAQEANKFELCKSYKLHLCDRIQYF